MATSSVCWAGLWQRRRGAAPTGAAARRKLTGACAHGRRMFGDIRGLFTMLDNDGPIARTMAAPYPIIDCEKMSAAGLTCNSVRELCALQRMRPRARAPARLRARRPWSQGLRAGPRTAALPPGLQLPRGALEPTARRARRQDSAQAVRRATVPRWNAAVWMRLRGQAPCPVYAVLARRAHSAGVAAAPALDMRAYGLRAVRLVSLQVINSNMAPPGNNDCEGFHTAPFEASQCTLLSPCAQREWFRADARMCYARVTLSAGGVRAPPPRHCCSRQQHVNLHPAVVARAGCRTRSRGGCDWHYLGRRERGRTRSGGAQERH